MYHFSWAQHKVSAKSGPDSKKVEKYRSKINWKDLTNVINRKLVFKGRCVKTLMLIEVAPDTLPVSSTRYEVHIRKNFFVYQRD